MGGVALGVPTRPAHYELTNLKSRLSFEAFQDIRDVSGLKKAFDDFQPDILFHLAAEPIVSACLEDPKHAFDTNVGGTVNILECIRATDSLHSAVLITFDKCYQNVEWDYGYRETDRLGGKDPYSASKACAEIAFSAYFRSFLHTRKNLKLATARAGNVIGDGDWAKDRIVCDCIRAISNGSEALIRNPQATRPWQLVLEPLSGYLHLGAKLFLEATGKSADGNINGEAFNFGPAPDVEVTVEHLLKAVQDRWPKFSWKVDSNHAIQNKEVSLLKLNCDRALRRLQWQPVLEFHETIDFLTDWYRQWYEKGEDIMKLSASQLEKYEQFAAQRRLAWAL